ncbi:MAG: DUF3592 domain-containing protein [Butyrivibrio sp.]|nr:DUF3592 domain-containing protein [Acetatifactor muris]MCM1559790.1 DUF3592 domain-containing protein [Butyrivibrio sp.]
MKKNKKYGRILMIVPGVFLVLGICMLICGACWLMSTFRFKETAVEIYGEITGIDRTYDNDGDEHYSIFVSYEYGGEKYENVRINSYNSNMYSGKKISLYCDPDNPDRVQAGSVLFFPSAILLLMGLLFALIGGGFLIRTGVISSRRKKVREQGISIYATVEEIIYSTNITVNGRHPYAVICTYRDEYKDITYRFKSESLWFDPAPLFPVGSTIEVRVDVNDYSKYYVNIEEAQNKVIDYT